MIVAGDLIDDTFCVAFSLSTMVAAGLGNTLSDVVGIVAQGFMETWFNRMGFETPKSLTDEQQDIAFFRMIKNISMSCGIVFGCIIGMCPILFMDPDKTKNKKRDKEMEDVLDAVIEEVAQLLNAQTALLMTVDHEKGELVTKATAKGIDE